MKLGTGLLFFISSVGCLAQSTDFLLTEPGTQIIQKLESKSGEHLFTSLKPYRRDQLAKFETDKVYSPGLTFNLSRQRLATQEYLALDTLPEYSDPSLFNTFYKNGIDFYSYREEDFDLHINPIWHFDAGKQRGYGPTLFTNSRGLEIRGTIDGKVSFYTSLTENQIEYPSYIKDIADSSGVIPYEGFWKEYNETTTDFLRAFGYLDFGLTKHVSAQFGFGRHFIGTGNRSMLLSDFSNSYPYTRIDLEIWRIKLTAIYAKLIADALTYDRGSLGSRIYPEKFMIAHYLDIKVASNFNVGLFESVIAGRPDSLGGSSLELEYLNPFIFFRPVEQQDGSDDNIILGLDTKWTPFPGVTVFGQFLLDELVLSEAFSDTDWWGNKYGYQLGANIYDFPLPDLDISLEYNGARPFTYAHQDLFTSYTHNEQPLAHPLGANFQEFLFQVLYQPFPRLAIQIQGLNAFYGVDEPEQEFTYGRNPSIPYGFRDDDYGQAMRQGIQTNLKMGQAIVTYQWKYNVALDLVFTRRIEEFRTELQDKEANIIQMGFRWNAPRRNYLF